MLRVLLILSLLMFFILHAHAEGLVIATDEPVSDPSGNIQEDYAGIGLVGSENSNGYKVLGSLKDGPADRAGVKYGDIITAVDGQTAAQIVPQTINEKLRGTAGTKVTITILRAGKPTDFQIVRQKMNGNWYGQQARAGTETQIKKLLPKAEQGDAAAEYQLGGLYRAIQNDEDAIKWFRKAADDGNKAAEKVIADDAALLKVDERALVAWASGTVVKTLTYDFESYQKVFDLSKRNFSDEAWQGLQASLAKSGLQENVVKYRQTLYTQQNTVVPPKIEARKMKKDGVREWTVSVPVVQTVVAGNKSATRAVTITMTIDERPLLAQLPMLKVVHWEEES